jgi:hypothetical protein
VRAAFTESRVFAEDLYHVLLVGLGIPGASLPEPDNDDGVVFEDE